MNSSSITQFDITLLSKVLSLLQPPDRRSSRQVCRQWNAILDQHVGLEVPLNFLNRPLMYFISRSLLTTIHLRPLTFQNLNSTYRPSQWIRRPHRVQSLIADRFIDVNVLEQTLEICKNLRHLKVSLRSLLSTNLNLEIWRASLRSLTSINILQNVYAASRDCDLALEILKFDLPNLKSLTLRFQIYQSLLDTRTISALQLGLIQFFNGVTCLRHVYIELNGRLRSRFALLPFAFEDEETPLTDGFNISKDSPAYSNLQHLCVRLPQSDGVAFWNVLTKSQRTLTKLILQLSNESLLAHLETIERNSSTLRTISLTGSSDDYLHLNYSSLANCSCLENLHLALLYQGDHSSPTTSIEIPMLPQTLQRLDISWIKVKTENLARIAEGLPNLRRLALVGCGEHEEYGVTVPVLLSLLLMRGLEELLIYNVNHHYVSQDMRKLVDILHSLHRVRIRVHIREGAFYIIPSSSYRDKSNSWYWGTSAYSHAPVHFQNPYSANEEVQEIV